VGRYGGRAVTDGPMRAASGPLRAHGLRRLRRLAGVPGDPYVFYTSSLAPVVLAVALLARRPGEAYVAVVLSTAAILIQLVLASRHTRYVARHPRLWPLARLAVPILYVGAAVQLIGGPALPLLALFAPMVAGAAAIGTLHGLATAGLAAVVYLGPEIGHLTTPAEVGLRGMTLAGVAVLLAVGTRRIVSALERAVREARASATAERRRGRQIAAIESVGRLLADHGPSPDLLERVLDVVVKRFGYQHATIYLGDERHVELVAQRGYVEAIAGFDPSAGVAGRVMRERQLAFVPDVAADTDYVPGTLNATSLITAPLLVDGRFLGLLNVETTGSRRLDATDRSLVGILAARISIALALGRDRQALQARAKLFRDIGTFSAEVSSSLAVGPLAEVLVAAIGRVVEAHLVVATLLERDTGRYVVRAVRGGDPAAVGREVRPGEGLGGRAIRDRAVVVDDALEPGTLPASVRDLDLPRLAHGVGLPLVRDGVVVGALTVARTADGTTFSDLEREGLQMLAGHAALAVANAYLHTDVSELAIRDPLTGLANRRHFDEALDRMLAVHRRERLSNPKPLSAILFDLDRFGAFNKEHGHQVGDAVLRTFGDVLSTRFRAGDLVARLGGEEFIVVLDGVDREGAVAIADEVRALLAARSVRADDGRPLTVTVSAGCAELDPADATRESLLRTADVALFMAKRSGRDRVVAA
jgi:diguanylate cyclase (GGDEF)-like protein